MKSLKTSIPNQGFTLIEVILALAVMGIIFGLGLFVSSDFYRTYSFQYERNLLVSVLEKARNQAVNNINQHEHGVYLGGSDYVIFAGVSPLSYASRITSLDNTVTASPRLTRSGLNTVIFKQLSGDIDPASTGTIVITDGLHTASISLNAVGQISW